MKRRNRNRRVVAGGVLAVFAAIGVAVAIMAPGAPGAGGALLPDIVQAVQEQGGPADGEQGADDGAASGRVVIHEEAAAGDAGALPERAKQGGDGDDGDKPDHEPGVALARLADGADEAAFREAAAGLPGVASVESVENGLARVALADGADEEAATAALGTLDQVDYSQPNFYYYLDDELLGGASAAGNQTQVVAEDNALVPSLIAAVSNDPRSNEQWGLDSVNAKAAWAKVDAKKVKNYAASVAVLDTGCLLDHEDLKGAVVAHYDATGRYEERAGKGQFGDIDGHGTHVCGIIAAVEGNKKGVAGIGHNKVGVVPVAVFRYSASSGGVVAETGDISGGLDWVAANASRYKIKAANMSLGRGIAGNDTFNAIDIEVTRAAERARNAGVLSVGAAGNDGNTALNSPVDAITTGLSVIALGQGADGDVERASYSSFNAPGSASKNISAPGSSILSTVAVKGSSKNYFKTVAAYANMSGTSMASPMVAGAAALVSAANPGLTPLQVREALLATAKDLDEPGFDANTGAGELDLNAAIAAALEKGRWAAPGTNSLSGVRVEVGGSEYDGKPKEPRVTVRLPSGKSLVRGTDYDVAYENNTAAGFARVVITGKGLYAGGTAEGSFRISAKSLISESFSASYSKSLEYKPLGVRDLNVAVDARLGSTKLQQGVDFKLFFIGYDGQGNVGARHFYIVGIGNYRGYRGLYEVAVTPRNIRYVKVENIGDVDFTGYPKKPVDGRVIDQLERTQDGYKTKELIIGSDYLVTYKNNVMPGKASATITGTGNYTGSRTVSFNVVADLGELRDNGLLACSDIPAQTYRGVTLKPAPAQILVGGKELVKGTNYKVTAADDNKSQIGTVTVSGIGKYYEGSFELDFDILKPLGALSWVSNQTYRGEPVEQPGLKVLPKLGSNKYLTDKDYNVSYIGNGAPGTAIVVVEGAGDYSGALAQPFKIYEPGKSSVPANDLGSAAVAAIPDKVYTGFEQRPEPEVRVSGKKLVKGKDFTYSYFANCDVGAALVVVTGKGSYVGACVKEFNITPASLERDVKVTVKGKAFDGSAGFEDFDESLALKMTRGDVELDSGTDFVATFANSFYPGTATVTLTGVGNYSGSVSKAFKVTYDLDECLYGAGWYSVEDVPFQIQGLMPSHSDNHNVSNFDIFGGVYDGSAKQPVTGVEFAGKTLVQGTDYRLVYKRNTNARLFSDGMPKDESTDPCVLIVGKGSFHGSYFIPFGIEQAPMSTVEVTGVEDKVYSGENVSQKAKLKLGAKVLRKGTDYQETYFDSFSSGTGRICFSADIVGDSGINYGGAVLKTFKIEKASIADARVKAIPAQAYDDGEPVCPDIEVTYKGMGLFEDQDFKVTFANNKKRGQASATIKGVGDFTGSKTVYFTIE